MIQIDSKSSANTINIPKIVSEIYQNYKIILENTTSKKKYTFDNLTDNNNLLNYYTFVLNLLQKQDGPYEYSLFSGNNFLGSGTLYLGKFREEKKNYKNNEEIKYYGK